MVHKMAEKLIDDATKKQEVALEQERIIMLEDLKGIGGPSLQ